MISIVFVVIAALLSANSVPTVSAVPPSPLPFNATNFPGHYEQCVNYCSLQLSVCTVNNAQFVDNDDCMAACSYYTYDAALNVHTQTSGTSVACHIYHTEVAQNISEEAIHCAHGGRWGTGVADEEHCGAQVDHYCSVLKSNCPWNTTGYDNYADCITKAANIDWSAEMEVPSTTDGDSLTCRVYHAQVARGSRALWQTHCPHASKNGGNVCVGPDPVACDVTMEFNSTNCPEHYAQCAHYCALTMDVCTGDNAQYVDGDDCMEACSYFEFDADANVHAAPADASVANSIACRIYHTEVAQNISEEDIHCAHGGRWGTGVAQEDHCSNEVVVYCDLLSDNCAWADVGYDDYDDCLDKAANLAWDPSDDVPTTTSGDTLTCRLYHAQVAKGGKTEVNAQTHCPHASYESVAGFCQDAAPPAAGCDSPNEFNSTNCPENYAQCEKYCDLIMDVCTGADAQYVDEDDCMAACSYFSYDASLNVHTQADGTSVACHIYHIEVAQNISDTTHCAHGGRWGTGVADEAHCGTQADHYCSVLMSNCPWNTTGFEDYDDCVAGTEDGGIAFEAGRNVPDMTTGDSLSCRVYHAQVARGPRSLWAVHCPHASLTSVDGVCTGAIPGGAKQGDGAGYDIDGAIVLGITIPIIVILVVVLLVVLLRRRNAGTARFDSSEMARV